MKFYHIALLSLGMISSASAANITIFYSPTCPHCHHARDFIKNELIYEYDDLKVTEVNASISENGPRFVDALKKCEYTNGGVPVLVIGEKCFQGYGDSVKDPIRAAVEVDLSDAQKQSAKANREELSKNHDDFIATHSHRQNAIVEESVDVKKN